jgi:hypothetical protein
MQIPAISIITPLYNRGWCIADCIASIGLGTAQAEMIVVDDGSGDDSVLRVQEAIDQLGISTCVHLIEQENAGPSAARNRAAGRAQGDWLVFLDSDDLWLPWTLPTLLRALSQTPASVDAVFLQGRNFSDPVELTKLAPDESVTQTYPCFAETVRAMPAMRYGACNVAIRKSAFLALGGFPTELRCMEDSDLFLRVAGEVMVMSAPVMAGLRRSGHESLTGNAREVIKGFHWLRDKAAARRYVGPPEAVRSFVAGSCAYCIRTAFGTGHPGWAYSLYLHNLGLLANPRTRRHLTRLPLTPLLHLLQPGAYPFRRRPG